MKKIPAVLALMLALALCLTACGGKSSSQGGASADLQAVLEKFALSDEMMTLGLSELNDYYLLGIAEGDVKQCAAAAHTSGINCDEIILIEATDADAAGRVKGILDQHFQAQKDAMRDYIPEEYAIMEKCSVTQNGNYVAMIVSPDAEKFTQIYNDSLK